MSRRVVRCQGVILKDNHILVLRQYNHQRCEEYWMLPGRSLEAGESEEECLRREMKEETGLEVDVKEILFDSSGNGKDVYKRYVTFLCVPAAESIEKIGSETVSYRQIMELFWVSIINESQWNHHLFSERFQPSMKEIKDKLLYLKER